MDLVWKTRACIVALLCLTTLLPAQQWEKITIDFQDVLLSQDQPTYKAYALLKDRVDIRALEAAFRNRNLPVDDRARIVVQTLTEKAAATQPSFLESLRSIKDIEEGSIKPYWITNMVFFEGSREAIYAVSALPAVASVGYDAPVEWIETESAPAPAPPSPNGTEPGLEAIGAPALWAMGYTGYGTRALIVDTGTEPDHPALVNQFLYNLQSQSSSFVGEDVIDCDGHGTHVAGTILGLDRLTNDTIGVAYEAKWMSGIALSGSCTGNTSVAGITGMFQWALNPDGDPATTNDIPDVINNSWRSGSTFCDADGVFNTYDALYAAGIAVVFSAGNDGPNPETITPPKFNNWDLVRLFSVGNLNANSPNLTISNGSSRGPSICGGTGSLLIKPEVSAPGSSVRSAYVGGGYSFLSGTSMAAPHVSGAILLLKEAFPYLTGEDLMLALYFSATDLGPEGEDNDYGMGIINLPAAYQYLIDQGHTAVPPRSFDHNARILRVNTPEYNCSNTVNLEVVISYAGPDTLQELVMEYQVGNSPVQTYEWGGLLPPNELHTLELPALNMPEGSYEAVIGIVSANGQVDERPEDNFMKTTVTVLEEEVSEAVLIGDTVCAGGNALLQVMNNESAEITWHSDSEGNTALGSGSPFLLENLTASSAIYAQTSPVRKVGRPNNGGSNTSFSNQSRGLRFNAFFPFTIRSVKVYAEETGGRLIQLVKPDGSVITRIVPITETGAQRIDLDLDISPGEGYILRLNGGKPLMLNTGGIHGYPMIVPGVVSITSSTLGGSAYFYFYDWEISYRERCGRSRVEVPVSADSLAEAPTIMSSLDTVDLALSGEVAFSTSPDGFSNWEWFFGDGQQASGAEANHTYDSTGTFTVGLNAATISGCTGANAKTITVIDNTPVVSTQEELTGPGLLLFPNPAYEQVNLQLTGGSFRQVNITLTDFLGRPLQQHVQDITEGETFTLSLGGYATGTYLIIVEAEGKRSIRRIVKAK